MYKKLVHEGQTIHPNILKKGHDRHIKGFILNKLYLGGYFCKRGKKHHGKHTSVENLPKGYPLKHRGKFLKMTRELKKDGFITVFPSAGEKHVCVVLEPEKIESGLIIVNAFRESVELLPLDKRFRKIVREKRNSANQT